MIRRYLAGQFADPHGALGRLLIGPWLDRIAGPSNRLALDQLRVAPGDRVLEVGFGGGELLRLLLASPAATVVGADRSAAMVQRAGRRFRPELHGGRLRLIHADVERLPLGAASIDKAVSVASIYFWTDPAAALNELARVIRAGGRLVVCFEPADELRKWPGHRHGFRLFEADEVAALVEAAGFDVTGIASGRGRKPDRFLCLSAKRRDANG